MVAITRVQGNKRAVGTTTPISIILDSTPIEGNILVATCSNMSGTVKTVSNITETNVTWTYQWSVIDATSDIEIWYGVVGASPSATASVAFSGNPELGAIVNICEYSGLLTSNFLDKKASGSGEVSEATTTGITSNTTQKYELWIGSIFCDGSEDVSQSDPIFTFTLLDGANYKPSTVNISQAYLERITTTTGSARSGTTPLNLADFVGCIATFIGTTQEVTENKDFLIKKLPRFIGYTD